MDVARSYACALGTVTFLGDGMAGLAVDPPVVDVAELPPNRSRGCLFAQPLAAGAAMRFPCFILLHIQALHSPFM